MTSSHRRDIAQRHRQRFLLCLCLVALAPRLLHAAEQTQSPSSEPAAAVKQPPVSKKKVAGEAGRAKTRSTRIDSDLAEASQAEEKAERAVREARDAATAAHEAAEAARAAAEAAHATAQAVHDVATHVEMLERTEPKEGPPLPEWSYQLALEALANTGNSSTFSSNVTGAVDGNWHDWSLELRLNGAYGATDPPGVSPQEITAFNGGVSARGERNFNPIIGTYAMAGANTDRVASIRYQAFGDLGLVLIWWEVEREGYVKSRLRTSIGLRVMHESRFTFYPSDAQVRGSLGSRLIYGPAANVAFRYALTKTTYASEDLEFLYNVAESDDMRLNSATQLVAKLTDRIDLRLGARIRYIGSPATGKKKTDTTLSTGIGFSF